MRSVRRISLAGRIDPEPRAPFGGNGELPGQPELLDRRATTTRTRLIAWALSLAFHGVFLAAVLSAFNPLEVPVAPNPERLIYVEPAPPPPPLPAAGTADVSADAPPLVEERAPELVELAASPKTIPTARRSPKPTARPARRQLVEPHPARAESAPAAETGGQAEGVAGGVAGGKVGGTVGGHGDAPIAAELAASPPLVLSRVVPEYPTVARIQRVEGQVLLRAVVDRSGHVEENIVVARSVPLLDAAAVAALRQWHFTPGRDRDGQTVRVQIEVPMRFQLR